MNYLIVDEILHLKHHQTKDPVKRKKIFMRFYVVHEMRQILTSAMHLLKTDYVERSQKL